MAATTEPMLLIVPYGPNEASEMLKPAIPDTWGAGEGENEPESSQNT